MKFFDQEFMYLENSNRSKLSNSIETVSYERKTTLQPVHSYLLKTQFFAEICRLKSCSESYRLEIDSYI